MQAVIWLCVYFTPALGPVTLLSPSDFFSLTLLFYSLRFPRSETTRRKERERNDDFFNYSNIKNYSSIEKFYI